jgi:hypothetical protein
VPRSPAVDEIHRLPPFPVDDVDRQLEPILVGRRLRRVDAERLAETNEPALKDGALVLRGVFPVFGELLQPRGGVGEEEMILVRHAGRL